MTYLTICQEVHNRLGMQGTLTTVSASGYQDIIAEGVSDAWRDVQTYRKDWHFLRTSKTLTVSAGVQTYNTYTSGGSANILTSGENARFGHWDSTNFIYNYKQLVEYTYDAWIRTNTSGAVAEPYKFSIDKSNNDVLTENLSTNKDITVTWYKNPQILVADGDIPECPVEHHPVVVWAGIKNSANFFGNSDAYQYAAIQYDKALGALMRSQIPSRKVRMRPLA